MAKKTIEEILNDVANDRCGFPLDSSIQLIINDVIANIERFPEHAERIAHIVDLGYDFHRCSCQEACEDLISAIEKHIAIIMAEIIDDNAGYEKIVSFMESDMVKYRIDEFKSTVESLLSIRGCDPFFEIVEEDPMKYSDIISSALRMTFYFDWEREGEDNERTCI